MNNFLLLSLFCIYHHRISKTTTLAGDPSISLRNNGKQTRSILLPKHCFIFETLYNADVVDHTYSVYKNSLI